MSAIERDKMAWNAMPVVYEEPTVTSDAFAIDGEAPRSAVLPTSGNVFVQWSAYQADFTHSVVVGQQGEAYQPRVLTTDWQLRGLAPFMRDWQQSGGQQVKSTPRLQMDVTAEPKVRAKKENQVRMDEDYVERLLAMSQDEDEPVLIGSPMTEVKPLPHSTEGSGIRLVKSAFPVVNSVAEPSKGSTLVRRVIKADKAAPAKPAEPAKRGRKSKLEEASEDISVVPELYPVECEEPGWFSVRLRCSCQGLPKSYRTTGVVLRESEWDREKNEPKKGEPNAEWQTKQINSAILKVTKSLMSQLKDKKCVKR